MVFGALVILIGSLVSCDSKDDSSTGSGSGAFAFTGGADPTNKAGALLGYYRDTVTASGLADRSGR